MEEHRLRTDPLHRPLMSRTLNVSNYIQNVVDQEEKNLKFLFF